MHDKTTRIRMLVIVATATLGAALLPGCAVLSRASEDPGGVQSNNESFDPALSSDGRWVAFTSPASNLVPGDTNGISDVFVRDNWTKTVALVSVSTAGDQADNFDQLQDIADKIIAMSDDGRIVAFTTIADNLVPGDDNGLPDVFWHDRDADQDGIFDEPGSDHDVARQRPVRWPLGNRRERAPLAQCGRIRSSRSIPTPRTCSPRRPRHELHGRRLCGPLRPRDRAAHGHEHRESYAGTVGDRGKRHEP